MSYEGFAKIQRQIIKWEWYQDSLVSRVFFHLMLLANHSGKNWKGIPIKRGQLITSRDQLSKELGLTVQRIRTALNKLKSTHEITIETTNTYHLITLNRYTVYNKTKEESNQDINQDANFPLTNEHPTDNQRITTTKNVKKEKNEKKTTSRRKIADWVGLNPPTLEMVKAFFVEKDFIIDAETFYNHYTCHDSTEDCWRNNRGDEVRSWKGTANTWNGRRLDDIKKENGEEYDAEAEAEGLKFIPRKLRNNNQDAYGRSIFVM